MTHKIMALLEGKQNSNPLKRSTLRLNSKFSPITLVGSHHKLHIRRHIPLYNSSRGRTNKTVQTYHREATLADVNIPQGKR